METIWEAANPETEWTDIRGGLQQDQTQTQTSISSEKIQDHETMVPFDVESLFTNVLIEGASQAALRKLGNDADKSRTSWISY